PALPAPRLPALLLPALLLPALLLPALPAAAGPAALPESWQPPELQLPSPHQLELEAHRDQPHLPVPYRPPGGARLLPEQEPAVDRTVYGYFPYWASGFDQIQWDLLTHIAYFSVGMNGRGEVTERRGWPDAGFVQAAHDHGVLVELTITLFDGQAILALCQSPERRALAVRNIVALVREGGADGVSIDFEGLVAGSREPFSTFIEELRAGFVAAGMAAASISIAGPTENWSDNWDLPRLLRQIDHFFFMGYGYHWRDSNHAGPVGQLRVGPTWRPTASLSMLRSIASWSRTVADEQRHQLVWGVPYYGSTWRTEDDRLASPTIGHIRNPTYAAMRGRLAAAGGPARRWEPESQNPWVAERVDGAWHQTWYDDEESLAAKYQLLREQGLGVGMWALGYDVGYSELWDLLRDSFTGPADLPAPGTVGAPLPIDGFPFVDRRDTTQAPSCTFNYYSPCAAATHEYGREWVYSLSLCQAGTLRVTVEDGGGVDIDIQLLDAPSQSACLARHDTTFTQELQPGAYWLTADTYVSNHVEQPGPYTLTVDFTPRADSPGCAAGESCQEGRCVPRCAPPLLACGGLCVDPATHPAHCGGCDRPCPAGDLCRGGLCRPEVQPEPDAGEPPEPDAGEPQGADSGEPLPVDGGGGDDDGGGQAGQDTEGGGGGGVDLGQPAADLGGGEATDSATPPADGGSGGSGGTPGRMKRTGDEEVACAVGGASRSGAGGAAGWLLLALLLWKMPRRRS
ncbi:MAG: hypothetical protein FJ125_06660, partial [Deltaproteobacteria bacterium]|nr:hypothetical protein [Deltaproteobacteria bacterium]